MSPQVSQKWSVKSVFFRSLHSRIANFYPPSEHAVAVGHCGHQLFHFSIDTLTSANDLSAVLRLQLGTLCLLLSSTVTLSLCLNLG